MYIYDKKSVTCTGACANEIMTNQSIDRSVTKRKKDDMLEVSLCIISFWKVRHPEWCLEVIGVLCEDCCKKVRRSISTVYPRITLLSTVFSNLRLLTHWNDNKNNKKYRKNIGYDVGQALTKNGWVNMLLTIPYWYLDLQRSNRTEAKLLQLQILHTCIHKYGVFPIVRRPISPTAH